MNAEERIWSRLPDGIREALAGLSGSELQSVLLAVGRDRAARQRPADVLRRWREDRFVRPAGDPRPVAAIENRLWQMLPPEFDAVELSPVVPLGTCTAVAPLSQNRVVTTMRHSEVVSDSTNALAVEAADRRSRQPAAGEVHLAACHRLLRAQRFPDGWSAHFRLFALVSSARDTGSARTETRLLQLHTDFWQRVMTALIPHAGPAVLYTTFAGPPLLQPGPLLHEEPSRERGRGYYTSTALRLTAGDDIELGDGGLTTWTAQLLGDAKERCLVSCIATERLTELAD
ncbi:hypothetical protein [Actinoplanes sp. NPDC026619]|uniref:hypothetical protein n=1 Tax=Actinoplanes sp. NPDC026619 TaxID=3155798 RepID=UPI0033D14AC8